MGLFTIKFIVDEHKILLVSKKYLDYFQNFIKSNILTEKKIISNSSWNYELLISFNSEDYPSISQPGYRNFSSEKKKLFLAFVPIKILLNSESIVQKSIAFSIYECICLFFLNHFKKIDRQYLDKKKEQIDWNYLESIPYPADEGDVEYLGMPLKQYKAMFIPPDEFEKRQQKMIEKRVEKPSHFVDVPFFNRIDINNLEVYYTAETTIFNHKVEINLHCYKQTLVSEKLKSIIQQLFNIEQLNVENKRELKCNYNNKGAVYFYIDEAVKNLGSKIFKEIAIEKNITIDKKAALLDSLYLTRIAFFPDVPHAEIVCDYVFSETYSDEIVVVFRQLNGVFDRIEIED